MIKHGANGQILSKEMKELTDVDKRSSECVARKMTPVECVRNGISVDKARQMEKKELTLEDAKYLLSQSEITTLKLSKLYGIPYGSINYHLKKFGYYDEPADKPVLPADLIQCSGCGTHFKKVELIHGQDGRELCLTCYNKNKPIENPEKTVLNPAAPVSVEPDGDDEIVTCGICGAEVKLKDAFLDLEHGYDCRQCCVQKEEVPQGTSLIAGVGPDVPTVINQNGGKQSSLPYAFHLIDSKAIFALAGVLHEGAEKYERDNWRKIPAESHVNHALSHIFAWMAGDKQDQRLAHAFTRLMMGVATDE